jgi:3-methylfumaryl-CoA hydratase
LSGVDIAGLRAWIGRQETRTDVITPAPVAGLSATLDYAAPRGGPGEPLPPLWHWLYFLPATAASDVASDGHARRGHFLPPVPLPRRMWAGSDIRFVAPLRVGDEVERVSTIEDVSHKRGRSGELVFVTVLHRVLRDGQLAIEERQRLVYREADTGGRVAAPSQAPPAQAQWSRTIRPDPVLLFRYSALTFNSHRIHYDRDYAIREEGYAGLVVQGPLTATLLVDLLEREAPGVQLQSFWFRGSRPLLDCAAFQLQGRCDGQQAELWALDSSGAPALTAGATFAGGAIRQPAARP